MKCNKNLRENRKNRNCLSESESCKHGIRFQGQLRFPRQAGDVPQPCRTGFRWYSQKRGFQFQAAGKSRGGTPFCRTLKTVFSKSHLVMFHVKHCSQGNQLCSVRQNRFAVCLCAVRRWLCCPNCFCIFLRLQFTGIFYAFRMANSIYLLLLDFNTISSIPLLRGTACPPFLKDALPFCPFGTFLHTVGNHPSPPS